MQTRIKTKGFGKRAKTSRKSYKQEWINKGKSDFVFELMSDNFKFYNETDPSRYRALYKNPLKPWWAFWKERKVFSTGAVHFIGEKYYIRIDQAGKIGTMKEIDESLKVSLKYEIDHGHLIEVQVKTLT